MQNIRICTYQYKLKNKVNNNNMEIIEDDEDIEKEIDKNVNENYIEESKQNE